MNKDIANFLNPGILPDYKAYMKKKKIVRDVLLDGESIVEDGIVSIESGGGGGDVEKERIRAMAAESLLNNKIALETIRATMEEGNLDDRLSNIATKEDIDKLF